MKERIYVDRRAEHCSHAAAVRRSASRAFFRQLAVNLRLVGDDIARGERGHALDRLDGLSDMAEKMADRQ